MFGLASSEDQFPEGITQEGRFFCTVSNTLQGTPDNAFPCLPLLLAAESSYLSLSPSPAADIRSHLLHPSNWRAAHSSRKSPGLRDQAEAASFLTDWRATGFSISPSLDHPVCDVGANLINPPWTMYSSYWLCSPHKPQFRDQMSNVRIEVFAPPGGPSVTWCTVLSKGL